MTSITCPCAECIHNGKNHKCTAKAIKLAYRNMMTVHEGRVDMWVCDHYELTDEAIKAAEAFAELAEKFNQKRAIDRGKTLVRRCASDGDSAEIRRCADCNRYIRHDHRCGYWNHGVSEDDFCSRAEERPE